MIATTHVSFAELCYLLVLTALGVPLSAAHAAVVAAASLLPDIDTPSSAVGRLCPGVAGRIERLHGHRTVTHSALGVGAVALIALPLGLLGPGFYACALAGYASHPVLDTMTVTGVPLFHPFSAVRCVFPFDGARPRRYRLTTGSRGDRALGLAFAAACVPLVLLAQHGYERVIRVAQGSVDAAVRDYVAFSGSRLVAASVEGSEALTGRAVRGTFPVIGALDAQTLLVRGPDGDLHTVGAPFRAEIAADRVVCVPGPAVRWESTRRDVAGRLLVQVVEELSAAQECYLFGSLVLDGEAALPEDPRVFRPVEARGEVLTLRYATAVDLERLALGDRVVVRGIVTIKARAAQVPPAAVAPPNVHLAFAAPAGDSLEVLVRPGVRIPAGAVMARLRSARAALSDLALGRAAAAEAERAAAGRLRASARRIVQAESAVTADDRSLAHARELSRLGYAAPASLAPIERRLARNAAALEAVREAAARSAAAIDLSRRRTAARLERLSKVVERERGRSALRAPCAGTVLTVRRTSSGGRSEVRITLRKEGR